LIARQLAMNPLVLACVAGMVLHATGIGLPPVAVPVFKALGQASLPLGLLCVGAALDFSTARSWLAPVGASSVAKFGLMPLLTVGACHVWGLHGAAALAALMFQSIPTASSSYIMAKTLGGNAPLMAGIVAAQTLLAGLMMPLAIFALAGWLHLA
jgi:predicted permease